MITGATGGIGAAFARELAALGRRDVHFVGKRWPELRVLLARNPVLKVWRLPVVVRAGLRRG